MKACIFIALSCINYLASGQIAPLWGSLECGDTVTGRFPHGTDWDYSYRYYTLTVSHPTLLLRDVWISTCTKEEDQYDSEHTEYHYKAAYTQFEISSNYAYLRSAEDPYAGVTKYASHYYWYGDDYCDDEERGYLHKFTDVYEGEYVFGFQSTNSEGGYYTLSVECRDPETPSPDAFANDNVTEEFPYFEEWDTTGDKKISCDVSASGRVNSSRNTMAWYQYEVTSWAQEIKFTTCDPELLQASGTITPYDGMTVSAHRVIMYYWDYENSKSWYSTSAVTYSNGYCTTLTIGDANSLSPESYSKQLSPGTYYVGVQIYSGVGGRYVLSMMCWRNAAVATATADTDYTVATLDPTLSPITVSPTAKPTSNPGAATDSPTDAPTQQFYGQLGSAGNARKALEQGSISCGIYQHGRLEKKRSHWYKFEVTEALDWFNFDTCKDDLTKFNHCIELYYLHSSNQQWYTYSSSYVHSSNAQCSTTTCNIIYGRTYDLPVGTYAIEIYGYTAKTDFGEYILRMGCPLDEYDNVKAVSVTKEPTPAPTGIAPMPAKDGNIKGDIKCGVTVSGQTKSRNGDFHKFTVIGGGIEWIEFDTCEATQFQNYLFIYDHYNLTGHEKFSQSLAYHYEAKSTCNKVKMHRVTPGVYYVNIDGYNYYFDHGAYTLTMKCSDASKIGGTSNFTEYKPSLLWWHILLIVLGCILFCVCIVGLIFYFKNKESSGSGGGDSQPPPVEMTKSASGPGDGGNTET